MRKKFTILTAALALLAMLAVPTGGWGQTKDGPTVLFHETFGDNPNSARAWDDDYSVKSGVAAVYSGITGYTVNNVKQSKNTMGKVKSGLVSNQATTGSIIIGPLNVVDYNTLVVSNYWGVSSGSNNWSDETFMKLYYSTTNNSDYVEVSRTGDNPTSGTVGNNNNFESASYTLPSEAVSSTLYLKFEFYCYQVNKNGTEIGQAYFDEVELQGVSSAPSISASAGTDLAYNATAGSIVYEIQNYQAGTMAAATEANWISNFTYDPVDVMSEVFFTVTANTDGPRQATVTLTYTYGDSQTATADVVVKQKGVPAITVTPATVEVNSALSENYLAIGLESLTIGQASDLGVQFYDENNQELNGTNAPNWITASVVAGEGSTGYRIHYIVDGNTGAARTAYFKVFVEGGDEDFIYSNLVTFTQTAAHTLTVLPYVDLGLFTFAGDDSGSPFGDNVWTGTVQVPTGTSLFISIEANEGYELESLLVNGLDVKDQIEDSQYIFEGGMPDYDVVISATAVPQYISTGGGYQLFTGDLVEGDYVIYYNGYAMKNVVSSNRLSYEVVSPNGNKIENPSASIVWHIAPSGNYWTIYNAEVEKYAASTGAASKAQLLSSGTDDMSLWTASGTESYDFVNKKNEANGVNKTLRNNGTYGFACYSTQTGGALSLYKKVEDVTIPSKTLNHAQWYFIASPVGTAPANLDDVTNVTDLYYYDEQNHFWRNKHNHTEGFDFGFGKGYLAAYYVGENPEEESIVLNFEGTSVLAANTKEVLLDYHTTTSGENPQTNTLAGWNLVGNPFYCNATIDRPYYTIINGELTPQANTIEITPCTGVLVQAAEIDIVNNTINYDNIASTVTFTKVEPTEPTSQPNQLQISIGQQLMNRDAVSNTTVDKAVISFNQGNLLEKFYFGQSNANIYIPQGNKEFAIVSAEAQGELPVNFRANADGQYTLTVNPEGIEMGYLHLIDNMTGANIDLLSTPAYTFNAKTTDYESRFRLVFSANNATTDTASEETFAFFSNGNLIVNNEGNATLQVVDVMGRVLSNQTISGTAELSLNQQPGVYVLRLVNGNDVKTQKIVVR
ncbi:MAG: T9SS type A sorting domain-containing protein [Bacteroidales bacterium]|nr:T9SS type A sorting domain-containing protein [Bacteroidales bacterium]